MGGDCSGVSLYRARACARVARSIVSAMSRGEMPRAVCRAALRGAGLCFVQEWERSGAPRIEGRH